ncbi:MAG: hypothetical protein IJ688_08145 [Treponema sp.]|nr:hypothetical protein [Treponema sp.]
MGKVGLVLCAICFLIILSSGIKACNNGSERSLSKERERGYNSGLVEGKKAAEIDYTKKIEKLKSDYESLLEKKKNDLEVQVTESYKQGIQQGKDKMTEEINSVITIKTGKKKQKAKKTKQNWNEVISTGGE